MLSRYTIDQSLEINDTWYAGVTYEPPRIQLNQALSIFEDNLDDIKESCQIGIVRTIQGEPKPEPTGDETLDDLRLRLYQLSLKRRIEGYQKTIKRIESTQYHKKVHRPGRITDADIEAAREYPIEELYDGDLKRSSRRLVGLCPFHDERSPSFYIHDDNRWSCFGCNSHGDAIDFYMRINNVDFINAVKGLTHK